MHLHSIGEEVQARVDVAFDLHPEGYEPKYRQKSQAMSGAFDFALDIRPTTTTSTATASTGWEQPARLITFEPHLHSSGRGCASRRSIPTTPARCSTARTTTHNWVKVYVYEEDAAPLLPAGTVIHLMAWYDNSTSNRTSSIRATGRGGATVR